MILVAIALGLSMQSDRAVIFHCGRPINAQSASASSAPSETNGQTAHIQSPAGAVVLMKAHSQDFHEKGAHLCTSSYSFEVTGSPGQPIQGLSFGGATSEWDRAISIHIDGFSPDGKLVYFLAVEGGEHPRLWAYSFDLSTTGEGREGRWLQLAISSMRSIPPECIMTLRFAGLSSDKWFVLATSEDNGCPTTQFWKLWPIRDRPVTEPTTYPYVPLVRLDSLEGVTPLDPGTVVSE
jgi:hypothetical protein